MEENTRHLIETALPEKHTWPGRPTVADLAPLPGCPAVYLFVDDAGAPLQLLTTQQLKRAAISRLSEPEQTRRGRVDLAEIARGIRWRRVYSSFEARYGYYQLARLMLPGRYRKELSFGPAWFLHIDWTARVPEPRVTEQIWRLPGDFIGPWPTRTACRQALEGLWDLFDLCRHPVEVRKSPHGQACAYADMGRCDAPCADSAILGAYIERVRAALRFASGEIDSWIAGAGDSMRRAAGEQQFELAGKLKSQLEFARLWKERWGPIVRPDQQLSYVLAVPATRRKAWKLYLFRRGYLVEGPLLSRRKAPTEAPAWLTEQLKRSPDEASDLLGNADSVNEIRMVQTWLVAHFLRHKESRDAVTARLEHDRPPANLAEMLAEPDS